MGMSKNTPMDRERDKFVETDAGDTAVRTVLVDSDIQIGAVEIKDATGSNRASVDSNGALKAVVSQATGTNLHAVIDSGAVNVSQATGTNLHAVIDSGAVTVSQATGTNLHAVIDSGSTVVTQATGTNLHAVVDSGYIQVKDQYGFAAENTPMDELRVAEATRLVGTVLNGTTIDSNFWTSTLANNGTATQGNNQIVLGSSTTNNGSSILQSVRTARYVASISNRFRAQVQLGDTGVADNTRRWGAFIS